MPYIKYFSLFMLMAMQSNHNYPLKNNNSFNIKASCSHIYFPSNLAELQQLPDLTATNFYILGEGSNTLFVEENAPVIIQPKFHGINIDEQAEHFLVTVGAAENWHDLVCFCLEKGINGLENLALIPGSVGAAPVQNIGAYGVEFADFCDEIQWYEFASKTLHTLVKEDCDFAYRESIFKHAFYNKGLITHVSFKFPKAWQPNLSYAGLDSLVKTSSATEVMNQVIALRSSKLPDPKVLPNAGSFFKNPVVSAVEFTQLQQRFPDIPHYPQANGEVKLAAAWLIDQAGLKGFRHQEVGVHQQQALVLVNYGSDLGCDIISLAKYVQRIVNKKFSVMLTPEVRMISAEGEQSFITLNDANPIGKLHHD
ncbi:UDP-N-acetylmuramate dehydrogenase [Colwellia echini]|nr:UDP-N-acetylmuramate dehydrogenase [Colwellia echini]